MDYQDDDIENDGPPINELASLKQRADLMGLKYSTNIGVDALRNKINAKLAPSKEVEPDVEEQEAKPQKLVKAVKTAAEIKAQHRHDMVMEQTKLIRVQITNMNPTKRDQEGEIVTVANRFVGTIRKYVPWGEKTDGGYHIPLIIYNMLLERKYLSVSVKKNRSGLETVTQRWMPEFAMVVMPQLTQKELRVLAVAQASAAGDIE